MKVLIFISITFALLYGSNAQSWENSIDSIAFYQQENDLKMTLKWAKLSQSLAEKEFGKDSNYATTVGVIAQTFYSLGQLDSAVYYSEQHVALCRQLFKTANENLAASLSNMAVYYNAAGRYKEAEALYIENLEMNRQIFKGDNLALATAINNTASFYMFRGKYNEADTLYKEALEMRKRIYNGDHESIANSYNNQASLYSLMGNFKDAEMLLIEALNMGRRLYKGDHPNLQKMLKNLGAFYNNKGEYEEAGQFSKEALEMCRRIYSEDSNELAGSLVIMAMVYRNIGNFKEAEPIFREALEIRRRLFKGVSDELAKTINDMAELMRDAGNSKAAESLFKESLEMQSIIFQGDHPALIAQIGIIAKFYDQIGKDNEAESLFKQALEMSKRVYKNDHPDLAKSMNNMASFLLKKDKMDEAEALSNESLAMLRRIFKSDNPTLAINLIITANVYKGLGKFEESEKLFIEALDMYKRMYNGEHPEYAGILNNIGNLYIDMNRYDDAETFYIEGIDVSKNVLNNYFPSLSEKEKKLFWNKIRKNFERFNAFAVKRSNKNPACISRMYDVVLYSKGILFNSYIKMKKRILNSGDSLLISQFKELSDKKDLLVKIYSMTEKNRIKRRYNLDSIEKVTNDLEKEISLKSELFRQSTEEKIVSWKSIQSKLQPDEVAVETVRFRSLNGSKLSDSVQYAFLILTSSTTQYPDIVVLENGKDLENKYFNDYRNSIKRKKLDRLSFKRYWEKLNDKIKGYKKVYFSADGIYNKVNPSTLISPDSKYLIELQDIRLVNSTRDIVFRQNMRKDGIENLGSAILVGNPNFAASLSQVREITKKIRGQSFDVVQQGQISIDRGVELGELPGTEKEVMDIEKLLSAKKLHVESYLGVMAIKAAIKSANNPGILHIATHGMFLDNPQSENASAFGFEVEELTDNPLLRSGLFFTGANNFLKSDSEKPIGDESAILTAYEAMNLELDRTEMVVLSACETGLGEINNGEGVYGLQRAFQQAGAKTVVMSLWSVSDQATQELMTAFYSNWVTGMTKRQAFSKAQFHIKDKYRDPYFWGAFVMVGE